MASVTVHCPRCQSANYRNGLQRSGRLGYGKDTHWHSLRRSALA
ncbi:hypothetical protein DMB85_020060 [Pectobacterium aquaticum]|uniref:InsA N-terminal zinc ribbon domain-containing protein n=1 Tax=Pectobacterium aquaticum TaxID=2204145 RepID=A0A426IP37_9GAMM|nr:hypothetical protein DMB79_003955 [Pectobacterium aquaticum]RRO02535.1 hypothetical protein DMB85_020060 [Pectobacterium aquaticum]